ncbi:MAG: hypothetical protein ACFFHD_14885 [Promethearchaeota archaeon]
MIIKVIDKRIKISNNDEESKDNSNFSDISNLIIPFPDAFKKMTPPDIYSGEEIIPFQEKKYEFKQILIHEFLGD